MRPPRELAKAATSLANSASAPGFCSFGRNSFQSRRYRVSFHLTAIACRLRLQRLADDFVVRGGGRLVRGVGLGVTLVDRVACWATASTPRSPTLPLRMIKCVGRVPDTESPRLFIYDGS